MSDQGDSVEDDEGGVEETIESEDDIGGDGRQTKKRLENEDKEDQEEEEELKEDEEEDEEEEEEKPPDVPLTAELIVECLSLLCKTGDGMAHAYVKLDASGRGLTDVMLLSSYIHVRYVDISKNLIRDLTPLNGMTHLLTLNAEFNLLPVVSLEELPYLQKATFAQNQLENLNGFGHPLLESLNLSFNKIPSFVGLDSEKLGQLHTLELRGNRLKSLSGINLPNLKNLYLAANGINSLDGLEQLENLQLLHLRENDLVKLNGFSANNERLHYVNLRGNGIAKLSEVRKMQCLPALQALVLLDNPIMEVLVSYRMDVLVAIQTLTRLDKDFYTDEEKDDASVMRKENKDDADENEEEEEEEEEEDDLIEKDDKDVKFKEPSNQSVQIGKAEDGDDYSTASDMESGAGDGDDDKEGDEDGDDS